MNRFTTFAIAAAVTFSLSAHAGEVARVEVQTDPEVKEKLQSAGEKVKRGATKVKHKARKAGARARDATKRGAAKTKAAARDLAERDGTKVEIRREEPTR